MCVGPLSSVDKHQFIRQQQHLGELLPRVKQIGRGAAEVAQTNSNSSPRPPASCHPPTLTSRISADQRYWSLLRLALKSTTKSTVSPASTWSARHVERLLAVE